MEHRLGIEGNEALTSLSALHGLAYVGAASDDADSDDDWTCLTITGNNSLPATSAQALVDAIDELCSQVTISGNAP